MNIELSLIVLDIDEDTEAVVMSTNGTKQKKIWRRADFDRVGPDFQLEIETKEEKGSIEIVKIRKGKNIVSTEKEIEELFINIWHEKVYSQRIEEMDGIESEDDGSPAAIMDKDPYDPKQIRVDTRPFSIHQINEMMQEGDIDLSPDFQREFVWQDITRKSRLIESLLLRIPLPVFYLAQDEEGRFKVVDGVQRLTVIRDFLANKFRLKNLEYLKECEGKWYKSSGKDGLDHIYTRRIDQTQLFFNIIDPQTPERVKYDIFKRINTGGKTLNAQEIRNCLEKPNVRAFIKRLAHSDEFLNATRHSISSTRMADNEIVLRFIAFYIQDHDLLGQKEYRGGMDAYLDCTVELLGKADDSTLRQIEHAFIRAMENAYTLFGQRAFRKANYINKALFLSWSRILCDMPVERIREITSVQSFDMAEILQREIENNAKYSSALSMATNDARNVEYNREVARKLLERSIAP